MMSPLTRLMMPYDVQNGVKIETRSMAWDGFLAPSEPRSPTLRAPIMIMKRRSWRVNSWLLRTIKNAQSKIPTIRKRIVAIVASTRWLCGPNFLRTRRRATPD